MEITITQQLAHEILEAEAICYGEGLGPQSDEWKAFLQKIAVAFPEVAKEYAHLPYLKP